MTKPGDMGEELFAQYLDARGYMTIGRDVDLGTQKRPDFLISNNETSVVVEVKSFTTQGIFEGAKEGELLTRPLTQALRPVRSAISAGAEQLKGIDQPLPTVVVLTNPLNKTIPLEPSLVVSAMYGDLSLELRNNDPQWTIGRNGRLYTARPDGATHGNHSHLSAVALLHPSSRASEWRTDWIRENLDRFTSLEDAIAEFLAAASDAKIHEDSLCIEVFETTSPSAVPLPRSIFNGPNDRRWGLLPKGEYGLLTTEE